MTEWVSGNVFIRKNIGEAGKTTGPHTHNFDHTTIFFRGHFRIRCALPDGRRLDEEVVAPDHRLIKAEVGHEIEFLSDGEFWCVYSHRDPQSGEVIQDYNGWRTPYV